MKGVPILLLGAMNIIIGWNAVAQNDSTSLIIKPGIGITDHIFIGQGKKEIRAIFGKSAKCKVIVRKAKTHSDRNKQRTINRKFNNLYCYPKKGVKIHFTKGKVDNIWFLNQLYKTDKGITIGSNREELTRLYGKETDAPITSFHSLGITFHFNSTNQVGEIEIFSPQ